MDWINEILKQDIAVPIAIFVAFIFITFWFRRIAYRGFEKWGKRTGWQGCDILVAATRMPSLFVIVTFGVLLALEVSNVHPAIYLPVSRGLWSLLTLVLTMSATRVARGLLHLYMNRLQIFPRVIFMTSNGVVIALLVVALLIILDIWGIPTAPLVLLIGIASLVALLAVREAMTSLIAGLQLTANQQIKVGDYIKLDTGEEGYVTKVNWRNTQLESLEATTIILPNHKLIQSKVINYGRPLKQATEPFRFHTRLHLNELTNIKASNLQEFLVNLKKVPESIIYYHTHHFIEEHHFLTPEPPNDFAVWVADALGNEALGERLASIDTFEFSTLGALRARLVDIIEEYLAREPLGREVLPKREFHFMCSVSVILPLPYIAHDLREFVEILRNVSLGSLYFHILESRLRLGKGLNDFSAWIDGSLSEPELANRIANMDPYNFTLEGLRSSLIQVIEKHIK